MQLFDHLVGNRKDTSGKGEPQRLGRLQVDHKLELGGLYNRQIAGLFTLRIRPA